MFTTLRSVTQRRGSRRVPLLRKCPVTGSARGAAWRRSISGEAKESQLRDGTPHGECKGKMLFDPGQGGCLRLPGRQRVRTVRWVDGPRSCRKNWKCPWKPSQRGVPQLTARWASTQSSKSELLVLSLILLSCFSLRWSS